MGALSHQGLGRVGGHHLAAAVATIGPQVDDPIGLGDDVQVVFDDHHAVARIDQAVQHADQLVHIGHVQTHRGLVQHIQGVGCFVAPSGDVVAHLGQFGDQLDALRLATTERGRGLAQGQIPQANIFEQLQGVADGGHGGKKVHRFVDLHFQHLANVFAAPAHRLRLGVEAAAVADLAQHFDVRQEVHLDGAHALAFAARAAAFAGVEAKAAGAITARLGLQGVGKQFANGVPKTNVGGGAAARGFANRGLVHLQHPVDAGITLQADTTHPDRVFARLVGLAPSLR